MSIETSSDYKVIKTLSVVEEILDCDFNGQHVEIDVVDAYRQFARLERQFKDNANECAECGATLGLQVPGEKLTCGLCQSDKVTLSQPLLDAIVGVLRNRYKVARVGSQGAFEFYVAVVERVNGAKKKQPTTAESPSGTESTPAA